VRVAHLIHSQLQHETDMSIRYRFSLLVAIVIAATGSLHAQRWHWAERVGKGPGTHIPGGIGIDRAGNSYVVGTFESFIMFNATTFNAATNVGLFLAKYDENGNLKWAAHGDGAGSFFNPSIAVDTAGNCYVTGGFTNNVSLGVTNLTSAGDTDIFIAKFDRDGNVAWANRMGGAGADCGRGVAVDSNGNCIVTGTFSGAVMFDTVSVQSAGGTDIFVARYTPFGNRHWVSRAGGTYDEEIDAVSVDGNGNSYVTGYFVDTTVMGNQTIISAGGKGTDILAARFTQTGALQWGLGAGGAGEDAGRDIAVDRFGNCYVTGDFHDTILFGTQKLISAGGSDIFLVKLNSLGTTSWGVRGGGPGDDEAHGVTTDAFGGSYITGTFLDTASFGGTGRLVDTNGMGSIYVVAFDNGGAFYWGRQAGGDGSDYGADIVTDRNGELRLIGGYSDTTRFGTVLLNDSGPRDIFIGKLGSEMTVTTSAVSPLIYCPGSQVPVRYMITGSYNAANVFTAQLSDSNGSFQQPLTIGTRAGVDQGTIAGRLPSNLKPGSRYRIRVVASTPAIIGADNGEDIVIKPLPTPQITPAGPVKICPGDQMTLDAGSGYSSYLWSTGASSRTISVSQPGNYTVTVTTEDGCPGTSMAVTVSLLPAPAKPTISSIGNQLQSTPADQYQWYFNDMEITGANSRTYYAVDTGFYRVRVFSVGGCSALSDPFEVKPAGLADDEASRSLSIYPHPSTGLFTVELDLKKHGPLRATLLDELGREVMGWSEGAPAAHYLRRVDARSLPAGVYFLRVEESGGTTHVGRVILQ
jgi:hypothetical protein